MKNKKAIAMALIGIVITVIFLSDSSLAAEKFYESIRICVKSLIPALFPFMVASDILLRSLEGRGGKYRNILLLLCGWLFGFPICAKSASELYSNGHIDRRTFERLVCCGGIPSLAFTVSVCGAAYGIFYGVLLYIITLISAAFCYFMIPERSEPMRAAIESSNDKKFLSVISSFCEAVGSSVGKMAVICGYVCFFHVLSELLTSRTDNEILKALVSGILEFSGGCRACIENLGDAGFVLCAAILSFSGISVFMQCAEMQRMCGLRPLMAEYFLSRLTQAAISAMLAYLCIGYIESLRKICSVLLTACFIFVPLLQRIYRKRLKHYEKRCIINEKV